MLPLEEFFGIIHHPADRTLCEPGRLQILSRPGDGGLGSVEMGDICPFRGRREGTRPGIAEYVKNIGYIAVKLFNLG